MKAYIISDTHFNHAKIIEYCYRPENHEDLLWDGLKVLQPDDLLIHLGDICIGKDEEVHTKLQEIYCRKVLVIGNHDHKSWSWYMDHGWDFVCYSFKLKYCGKVVCFSHKPVPWDGHWEVNVHGHLHNIPQLSHHKREYKELQAWHRTYAPELMHYKPVELSSFIQKEPV